MNPKNKCVDMNLNPGGILILIQDGARLFT